MSTLKRHPQRAAITLDDGKTVEVERLGKGRFTTAWLALNDPTVVYLQVKEDGGDYSKEILCHLQDHAHIPQLQPCGEIDGLALYRSRYYFPLTAKSKIAWSQFRVLQKHAEIAWRENYDQQRRKFDTGRVNQAFADAVAEDESLPEDLRDACEALVTWCGSYGEYAIEIAARNLAVDEGGRLILLDPCFNYAEVHTKQMAAAKRARGW